MLTRTQKLGALGKTVAARRKAAKQDQPSQQPNQNISPDSSRSPSTLTRAEIMALRDRAMARYKKGYDPEKIKLDLATLEAKQAIKK